MNQEAQAVQPDRTAEENVEILRYQFPQFRQDFLCRLVKRAVEHQADGASVVVYRNQQHRAGKIGIGHGLFGYQEHAACESHLFVHRLHPAGLQVAAARRAELFEIPGGDTSIRHNHEGQ